MPDRARVQARPGIAPALRRDAPEPRDLLPADLMPFAVDPAARNAQHVALRHDKLTPSIEFLDAAGYLVLDRRALQPISAVRLGGTAGDDRLVIALAEGVLRRLDAGEGEGRVALRGADAGQAGKVVVRGGGGSDAITGPPADTRWHVTGRDWGHVAGVSFLSVENLIGAAGNEDAFVVHGDAAISARWMAARAASTEWNSTAAASGRSSTSPPARPPAPSPATGWS